MYFSYQSRRRRWKSPDQGRQLYAPLSNIRQATLMTFVSKMWVAISDLVDRSKDAIPVCHVLSSRAGIDVSPGLEAHLVKFPRRLVRTTAPCYAYLPAGIGNLAARLADYTRGKISKCSLARGAGHRSWAWARGRCIPFKLMTSLMVTVVYRIVGTTRQ